MFHVVPVFDINILQASVGSRDLLQWEVGLQRQWRKLFALKAEVAA